MGSHQQSARTTNPKSQNRKREREEENGSSKSPQGRTDHNSRFVTEQTAREELSAVTLLDFRVLDDYRTTRTSLTLSRARKNLMEAKSRNRVSIWRVFEKGCRRETVVVASW